MNDNRISLTDNGPHSYGAELVSYSMEPVSLQVCAACVAVNMTFAHVLNVHDTNDVWPGDAAELFFREFWSVRQVCGKLVYCQDNLIYEHMRCEILRLCDTAMACQNAKWEYDFGFDCPIYQQNLLNKIEARTLASFADVWDSDGCEDDEEEDTLNSDLLITEEYLEPDEANQVFKSQTRPTPDASGLQQDKHGPDYRAIDKKPTE